MKVRILLFSLFIVALGLLVWRGTPGKSPPRQAPYRPPVVAESDDHFLQLPLQFEANEGQADAAARFVAHGPGYNLLLTPWEAVLGLLAEPRGTRPSV